jgi:hypothetical protein
MRRPFLYRQLSQYEGEKRLDKQLERVVEGDLSKRTAREPVTHFRCDRCRQYKRSRTMIRARGSDPRSVRVEVTKVDAQGHAERTGKFFSGWYLRVCDDCKPFVQVPIDA